MQIVPYRGFVLRSSANLVFCGVESIRSQRNDSQYKHAYKNNAEATESDKDAEVLLRANSSQ